MFESLLSYRWNRALAVTSSFLLYFANGIPLYIGNLSVYLMSYVKEYVDSSSAAQAPWILYLHISSWGLGNVAAGLIAPYTRKKMVCLGALGFYAVGLFTSYVTVQTSVLTLCLTLGILCGFAGGLITVTSIGLVIPWAEDKKGLFTSILLTSPAINSIFMDEFITIYINPENKSPDKLISDINYFSQKDILDRTPSVFVYIGMISMGVLGLGFLLIREKLDETTKDSKQQSIENPSLPTHYSDQNRVTNSTTDSSCNSNCLDGVVLRNGAFAIPNNDFIHHKSAQFNRSKFVQFNSEVPNSAAFKSVTDKTLALPNDELYQFNSSCKYLTKGEIGDFKLESGGALEDLKAIPNDDFDYLSPVLNGQSSYHDTGVIVHKSDLKLKTLLKSKDFYISWVLFLMAIIEYNFVLKYYKVFGSVWIPDDYFLSHLGMVLSCTLSVARPLSGAAIDRFGVKRILVAFYAVVSVLYIWVYFTALINPWMYSMAVFILWNTACCQPVIFTALSMKLFGEKNFSTVFGMMSTATVLASVSTPMLLQLSLDYFGWFVLFLGLSLVGTVALLCAIRCLPESLH